MLLKTNFAHKGHQVRARNDPGYVKPQRGAYQNVIFNETSVSSCQRLTDVPFFSRESPSTRMIWWVKSLLQTMFVHRKIFHIPKCLHFSVPRHANDELVSKTVKLVLLRSRFAFVMLLFSYFNCYEINKSTQIQYTINCLKLKKK